MGKIKRTYSLAKTIVEMIEQIARETRRDKSTVVEMAVAAYVDLHLAELLNQARPSNLGRLEDAETVDLMAAAE